MITGRQRHRYPCCPNMVCTKVVGKKFLRSVVGLEGSVSVRLDSELPQNAVVVVLHSLSCLALFRECDLTRHVCQSHHTNTVMLVSLPTLLVQKRNQRSICRCVLLAEPASSLGLG
eukprot:367924-Amphidinium_carterae.1